MKLRLVQKGFENYTGQMGVTFFEAGLSTADVSMMDATRMSAVMGCEWEDGTTMSVAQRLLDEANTPAPMFTKVEVPAEIEKVVSSKKLWAAEELEAIADEKGIAGLREVGDTLGIKGVSIKGLMDEILAANDK